MTERNRGHWLEGVEAVLRATTGDLRELAIVAGGNPANFYIGTDLTGVDISGQDLRGMKFTGLDSATRDKGTLLDPDADLSAEACESADDGVAEGQLPLFDASDLPTAPRSIVEQIRWKAVHAVGKSLEVEFFHRSGIIWSDRADEIRIVVAVSKHHSQSHDYWYGFRRIQREFIRDVKLGFLVLCGVDLDEIYVVPYEVIDEFVDRLSKSGSGRSMYWHVRARIRGGEYFLIVDRKELSMSKWRVQL